MAVGPVCPDHAHIMIVTHSLIHQIFGVFDLPWILAVTDEKDKVFKKETHSQLIDLEKGIEE